MPAARVKSLLIRAHLSTQDGHARAHVPQDRTTKQGWYVMDCDRKAEGGASSKPAFNVSQVCLKVSSLFGLTIEIAAILVRIITTAAQIERGQGGARLETLNVTCDEMADVECLRETCRLVCLIGQTCDLVWGV